MEFEDDLNRALEDAKHNRSSGWTALYKALAPTVTGYLRAQGSAEPEDLAAEVFVQAVKNVSRFQGDFPAFRSWIFCIAHNKLVDDARYRSRRPVHPMADAGTNEVCSTHVEDQVMSNLANDRVRSMIEKLTPDQSSVLFLRILGGLTVEEVSRAVGKPVTAVKALQRRGLASIRREISVQTVSV